MAPPIEPQIVQFIRDAPSTDLAELSGQIHRQFGVRLAMGQIKRVLASPEQREKVARAKSLATDALESRVGRIQTVEDELYQLFQNEPALRDKLDVAKELRQWIKQGIDVSGMYDEETDTIFVIESDWSTRAQD